MWYIHVCYIFHCRETEELEMKGMCNYKFVLRVIPLTKCCTYMMYVTWRPCFISAAVLLQIQGYSNSCLSSLRASHQNLLLISNTSKYWRVWDKVCLYMTAHKLHARVHSHSLSIRIILFIQMHMCCFTGEYGIVYKAQLVRGGLPQLVAVKTVKGKACCM